LFTKAPTVNFSQPAYRVDENAGQVQPVLVLSNPSSTDITVQLRLLPLVSEVTLSQNVNSSNNATGGGVDYNSGPYTVTFTAGQTSAFFGVPINDDNILENTEMFTLIINSATLPSHVTVSDPDQSTVDILESDSE